MRAAVGESCLCKGPVAGECQVLGVKGGGRMRTMTLGKVESRLCKAFGM